VAKARARARRDLETGSRSAAHWRRSRSDGVSTWSRADRHNKMWGLRRDVNGALNVDIRLVAVAAAAPYFYGDRRGRYAAGLRFSERGQGRGNSASGERAHARRTTPMKGSKRGVETSKGRRPAMRVEEP
jgi:hypothetical protein